jgi:hypothetical protein
VPSFYSVVQFVPDPIRDERLNFGVVVFDEDVVRCQFLSDWARASRFSGSDVSFLRDFAQSVQASSVPQIGLFNESPQWSPQAIREAAGHWVNSIQLTEPRASTLDTEKLLPRISARYLPPAAPRRRTFRDRRAAVAIARANLLHALDAAGAQHKGIVVAKNVQFGGALDQHTFDLGLQNGHLLHGIQGMSFEGPTRNELIREVDATAWSISDIHESTPELPITIVALPPRTTSKAFETARRIFRRLDAQVVEESEVESWAQGSVGELLAAELPAG